MSSDHSEIDELLELSKHMFEKVDSPYIAAGWEVYKSGSSVYMRLPNGKWLVDTNPLGPNFKSLPPKFDMH